MYPFCHASDDRRLRVVKKFRQSSTYALPLSSVYLGPFLGRAGRWITFKNPLKLFWKFLWARSNYPDEHTSPYHSYDISQTCLDVITRLLHRISLSCGCAVAWYNCPEWTSMRRASLNRCIRRNERNIRSLYSQYYVASLTPRLKIAWILDTGEEERKSGNFALL